MECSVLAGDGKNLDLNLGISITIDSPQGCNDKGVGGSQTPHLPLHLASGKWPVVSETEIRNSKLISFKELESSVNLESLGTVHYTHSEILVLILNSMNINRLILLP